MSRGQWKLTPHLAKLNRKLVDLAARRIQRLIVSMPPRHGKSELCSKFNPAWYLGNFPKDHVGIFTYSHDFSQAWGVKAGDVFKEASKLTGVQVNPRLDKMSHWGTMEGGSLYCAGVGGSLTGRGFNYVIIDDPIKNSEEALSETIRQKHWEWWQTTLRTRLQPDAVVLMIATRWHEDDLIGMVLQNSKEKWDRLELPAIGNDGAALWPEQFPLNELCVIRDSMEPYWWEAIYQQRPGKHTFGEWPKEYFQNLYIADEKWPSSFDVSYVAVDPSKGKSQTGDYSAIVFIGVRDGLVYVDSSLARRPVSEICNDAIDMCDQYRPNSIGFEANGFQFLVATEYERAASRLSYSTAISTIDNSLNKELRINRLGAWLFNKLLRFKNTPSNRLLVRQLEEFPNGKYDDGPDSLEMALRMLIECGEASGVTDYIAGTLA